MAWPIPAAKTIAERIAGTLEAGFLRIRPTLDPVTLSRAVRSARGNLAQMGRAYALEARELHDHLSWATRQIFIDSVDDDEMILRHAGIWGIEQRGATTAIGTVTIEGVPGAALPVDLEISASDGTRFLTSATATIAGGGSVDVPARASLAGLAGNIEAGIRLVTVAPFPTISRVTVASDFAGGADEEDLKSLQTTVQQRIRQPPHGGAGFDYPQWVARRFAVKAVSVVPGWIGRGSVGIVVAMLDGDGNARPATAPECTDILDHLGAPNSPSGLRPVTAHIVVVPAVLRPIAISVRVRPDTVAVRAAVTAAFARYVATIGDEDDDQNSGPIGARIEPSRISDAISAASGEYAHDLTVPAASYALGNTQFPTIGTITFLAAT